jgi:hypothetical protein
MMSGVPLETCWSFKKLWNSKFYYKAASCWYFCWVIYDARIHDYQIHLSGDVRILYSHFITNIWSLLCYSDYGIYRSDWRLFLYEIVNKPRIKSSSRITLVQLKNSTFCTPRCVWGSGGTTTRTPDASARDRGMIIIAFWPHCSRWMSCR